MCDVGMFMYSGFIHLHNIMMLFGFTMCLYCTIKCILYKNVSTLIKACAVCTESDLDVILCCMLNIKCWCLVKTFFLNFWFLYNVNGSFFVFPRCVFLVCLKRKIYQYLTILLFFFAEFIVFLMK